MSVAATATAPTARRVHVQTPPWPRALAALVGRGLREQRVAILGWGVGLGLMGALLAAMWPSVQARWPSSSTSIRPA